MKGKKRLKEKYGPICDAGLHHQTDQHELEGEEDEQLLEDLRVSGK